MVTHVIYEQLRAYCDVLMQILSLKFKNKPKMTNIKLTKPFKIKIRKDSHFLLMGGCQDEFFSTH